MVYVDDMSAPLGRMIMSHMVADTHAELMVMAKRIGLQWRWVQLEGTYREHFDLCQSKRKLAVALGAREITRKELGVMLQARRLAWQAMEKLKKQSRSVELG